jgi:hypothetical protein
VDNHAPQSSARIEQSLRSLAAVRGRGQKARVSRISMGKMISGAKDIESITTVMLRNLPIKCQLDELVHALDSSGFKGTYDFCYMPCGFKSTAGKGYAFVNFQAPSATWCFKNTWHGSQQFPNHPDSRPLQVTAAHIQGYKANMAIAVQTIGLIRNPNFRRLVFSNRDPACSSMGMASPVAQPATGVPAAPPQLGGRTEGAGPQQPVPRPRDVLSACAGAGPQAPTCKHHAQQQPTAAGWPAVRCPVNPCQQADRVPFATCAPRSSSSSQQQLLREPALQHQLAAGRLATQPGTQAFPGPR